MKELLNTFMGANGNLGAHSEQDMSTVFQETAHLIAQHIGSKAFKPKRALNAAILDSIMVRVARNSGKGSMSPERMLAQYKKLLSNTEYQQSTETHTTDEQNVRRRLDLASRAFDGGR